MGNSLISSLRECALVELSDMSTVADEVFFESLGFDPSPFSKRSRALFIASVEFEGKAEEVRSGCDLGEEERHRGRGSSSS